MTYYKYKIGKKQINFGTGTFGKVDRLKSNKIFSQVNLSIIPRSVTAYTDPVVIIEEGTNEITITTEGATDTIFIYLPFAISGIGPIHIVIAENQTVYIIPKDIDKFRDADIGQSKICSVAGERIDLYCNTDKIWDYSETSITEPIIYVPSPGIIIAGTFGNGRILRSINNGLTWTNIGTVISGEGTILSSCNVTGEISLCGGGSTGKIARSIDYGLTWTNLGVQATGETQIRSMTYVENGICLAGTGLNGHIVRSEDYGATWTDLGQQASQAYIDSLIYLGNGICLAGTGNGGKILRSTDYGENWTDLGQIHSAQMYHYFADFGGGIVCACGHIAAGPTDKMVRSTDYGATWSDLGSVTGNEQNFSMCSLGNGIGLVGSYNDGEIWRSTDYGATWGFVQNTTLYTFILINVGSGIALAGQGNNGKIFRSIDYGANWTDLGQQAGESQIRTLSRLL